MLGKALILCKFDGRVNRKRGFSVEILDEPITLRGGAPDPFRCDFKKTVGPEILRGNHPTSFRIYIYYELGLQCGIWPKAKSGRHRLEHAPEMGLKGGSSRRGKGEP